jgi:protein arginine N-methyltransferase 3
MAHNIIEVQSNWSDSEDEDIDTDPERKIRSLRRQLAAAKLDLLDFRTLVTQKVDKIGLSEAIDDIGPGEGIESDDKHYFQSYGENGWYSQPSCFNLILIVLYHS